jgi:predicted pyridoxine 5'-phosphate oxidase superfamily flavin-nucleotide-binding protein
MFFFATADEAGRPDCSYKGGDAGFVRVMGDDELVFPSYDGNGMFRSIGNLSTHAPVGLLFIDFEQPRRLRVNGLASVLSDDPLRDAFTGAQLVVHVRATHIFPNCPRYIHRMQLAEPSPYVPRHGVEPPVPAWKQFEMFSDVLPREGRGGRGGDSG